MTWEFYFHSFFDSRTVFMRFRNNKTKQTQERQAINLNNFP